MFRGTIQLIPNPFETIIRCIDLLKPGGILVLLATPNSRSPYYYLFKTLPFISEKTTFLLPSDLMMRNLFVNYGLRVATIKYPYFETPYARPARDFLMFILGIFGIRKKFPFPRSSMEIVAIKE